MKKIVLPDHPVATGSYTCPNCGEEMVPFEGDSIYGDVKVCGIHGWYCFGCDFEMFSSDEAKMIEKALEEAKYK